MVMHYLLLTADSNCQARHAITLVRVASAWLDTRMGVVTFPTKIHDEKSLQAGTQGADVTIENLDAFARGDMDF